MAHGDGDAGRVGPSMRGDGDARGVGGAERGGARERAGDCRHNRAPKCVCTSTLLCYRVVEIMIMFQLYYRCNYCS
jgi:hypothetical protein